MDVVPPYDDVGIPSYCLICIDSLQRPVGVLLVAMDLMTVSVKAPKYVHPASSLSLKTAARFGYFLCSGGTSVLFWGFFCILWLTFRLSLFAALLMRPCPCETGRSPCRSAHLCPGPVIISNAIPPPKPCFRVPAVWLHPCMSFWK